MALGKTFMQSQSYKYKVKPQNHTNKFFPTCVDMTPVDDAMMLTDSKCLHTFSILPSFAKDKHDYYIYSFR